MATFDAGGPYLGRISAVGLDSAEVGHPPSRFRALLATVNSDDPAYFGGYVGENFAAP